MRLLILFSAAILALQACEMQTPQPVEPPPPASDLSTCHAVGLEGLIGAPVTLLPEGSWSTLRVIKPGMMVTMDYSATRLNVRVDGRGTLLALDCG